MDCRDVENCLDDGYFALLDEEVDSDFHRHIAECPLCQQRYRDRKRFWSRLRDIGESIRRRPPTLERLIRYRPKRLFKRKWFITAVVASAASILIFVSLLFVHNGRDGAGGRVLPWSMDRRVYEFRVDDVLDTDFEFPSALLPKVISVVVDVNPLNRKHKSPRRVVIRLNEEEKEITVSDKRRIEFAPESLRIKNRLYVKEDFKGPVCIVVFINWCVDGTHSVKER